MYFHSEAAKTQSYNIERLYENGSMKLARNKVRLKPVCLATEISLSIEILHIASEAIILSINRLTKALIRLRIQQSQVFLRRGPFGLLCVCKQWCSL